MVLINQKLLDSQQLTVNIKINKIQPTTIGEKARTLRRLLIK